VKAEICLFFIFEKKRAKSPVQINQKQEYNLAQEVDQSHLLLKFAQISSGILPSHLPSTFKDNLWPPGPRGWLDGKPFTL
jgi:hypothetical protein